MSDGYPQRIRALPANDDDRFDAYKLEAKGADVLFASYPGGTSVPTHTHDTDNYGVVTRGEIILTVNDRTTRVGVGQWYHVPAHAPHSAQFEVDTDEIEFWFDLAGDANSS